MNDLELLTDTPTEQLQEIEINKLPDDMTGNTPSGMDNINRVNSPNTSQVIGESYQPTQAQTINIGSLLSPKVCVELLDTIVPVIFVLLMQRFFNQTVSKKAVHLTRDEKETIEPVLENYLKSVNFSVEKPFDALLLTVGVIYGMKFIEIKNAVPSGNFNMQNQPAGIGQPTANGTIKRDGRGRPKGSIKKQKQVI